MYFFLYFGQNIPGVIEEATRATIQTAAGQFTRTPITTAMIPDC